MEVGIKFMEPFERDQLEDRELDAMLQEWRTPRIPARLRQAVFPKRSQTLWLRLWTTSIRVPLPIAAALLVADGPGLQGVRSP